MMTSAANSNSATAMQPSARLTNPNDTLATPLLRVGCWFFAALGLWWLALRPDVKPEARAFSVMGTVTSLLYLLTYLPFGVAPEFRYAYPAIMLTTFSGCVLAPQIATRCAALYARWRGRHDAAAATPA